MTSSVNDLIAKADRYLQLCEERKLEEASLFLAPNAVLTFPGGVQFTALSDMVKDAANRYREVRKRRTTYISGERASDGKLVVVSVGTLYGTALDGSKFSDVRYSDIFVFQDGLIVEQNVLNDMAEFGIVPLSIERPHSSDAKR